MDNSQTFLEQIIQSPGFYFCTGSILLVFFFWYLAAESDKVKRAAGTCFIVGISAFSLFSLLVNGMHYGIDISGGVELTLKVQPKLDDRGEAVPPTAEEMQQACDILDERLNATGTSEVQILHSGDKILIQIPRQSDDDEENRQKLDAMVSMLTKMAKLELLAVSPDNETIINNPLTQQAIEKYRKAMEAYDAAVKKSREESKEGIASPMIRKPMPPRIPMELGYDDYQILPHPITNDKTGEPELDENGKPRVEFLAVSKTHVAMQKGVYITGKDVSQANPDYSRKGHVNVVLSREGASRMGKLTGSMQIGRDRLAVVLNDQIKCAPTVQDVLHKEFNISGLNGKGEPEDISRALANPLSSDLVVEGRKDVSAQLGKTALEQACLSGIIGMLAVFVFCFWYYRNSGAVATVGLTINVLILLGLMSLFGFVLTLPGIAGVVLTLGVAVDANVLIYERMREERAAGRPFIICVRNAYEKAFSAIWDSNITSLITAVILFWLASGSIKGFAVTTSVGIVTSLIGAIVVTRVLFFWAEKFGLLKGDFKFARAPFENKKYDFMKWGKTAGIASVVVITASLAYTFFVRGEDSLGVDFTGGETITYVIGEDEGKVDIREVEDVVADLPLSKAATVQEFDGATGDNIKIRCAEGEADMIEKALSEKIPAMNELKNHPSREKVSAALGSNFFITAIWALVAGMVGITIYLAIRFEWTFAVGALLSIFHDVFAVIGLVVLFGSELSIIHIGAFLTVAGYSINDTIVVYDRIREELRLAEPKEKLRDIINTAINNTLSRTMLTGPATIAVLVALLALGGPSMKDFSLTMLLGVVVGTYSSIYISAPIVLWFDKKHDLRAEVKRQQEMDAQV